MSKKLTQNDYEFMNSLSAAVLQKAPSKIITIMYFWAATITIFIIWAYFAQIDEIARGDGAIVPSGKNQMIQNLEGGIVEEILVEEGQSVEKEQVLIKINNEKSKSELKTNAIKANAIEAKIIRLKAESSGEEFTVPENMHDSIGQFIEYERSLYETNMQKLNSKISVLKEQLNQKRQEYSEAKSTRNSMKASLEMITKEVKMTRPMVAKGVRSKIDFLKLQREANDVQDRYNSAELSLPRLSSAIEEIKNSIKEAQFEHQSKAKLKLNEAFSELNSFKANSTSLEDEVIRTVVLAPHNGIVQNLFVNTVGGVIKPGANILEIVPTDSTLLAEINIKPSDIAFIYYGQKAIIKFTAYDFSIYGGLEGEVVLISPDTVKDEKGGVFYKVKVKTNKNYLERDGKRLKIIPGMTVTADIITGRKTVLDYILKPILKTKQYTFTER